MGDGFTASGPLAAARSLVEVPDPGRGAAWPRVAAHLTRQALEDLLARFWSHAAPGTEQTTLRTQLTCLPYYLDERLAERVAHAWSALSRACHHQESERLPLASELRDWIGVATELEARVGGRA